MYYRSTYKVIYGGAVDSPRRFAGRDWKPSDDITRERLRKIVDRESRRRRIRRAGNFFVLSGIPSEKIARARDETTRRIRSRFERHHLPSSMSRFCIAAARSFRYLRSL